MHSPNARIHSTAEVDGSVSVASGTAIWNYAQVRENATIGENCVIGRGAYIGSGVEVGDNCKIQNYALVYEPSTLANGVFVGPAVVFTNDRFPRAVNVDGTPKTTADWEPVGVTVCEGASIGAKSVCIAPVTIGAWALVGSGSTVIRDVPAHALVVGNPARRVGWVGRAGLPLNEEPGGTWICPATSERYEQVGTDALARLDLS